MMSRPVSTMNLRRLLIGASASGLCAAALAPGVGSAATVSLGAGGEVVYQAAPGEANHAAAYSGDPLGSSAPGTVVVEDGPTTLSAGPGCTLIGVGTVACGDVSTLKVVAKLGDGDDFFSDERYDANFDLQGGAGDDTLEMFVEPFAAGAQRMDGGPGNDHIRASAGSTTTILGGGGDDWIQTFPNGPSSVDAGAGDDTVEWGVDSIFRGVVAPDKLVLGAGNDELTLAGDAFQSWKTTPYGRFHPWDYPASVIDAGTGTDTLKVRPFTGDNFPIFPDGMGPITFSLREADTGLEILDASAPRYEEDGITPERNLLIGGDEYGVFRGGPGKDVILPGRRADWVSAGAGIDMIISDDGAVDHIACGAGGDYIRADKIDLLYRGDCEKPYVPFP